MANKPRVPRPAIQAPKRRDARRSGRPALPAWPRRIWLVGCGVLAAILLGVAVYGSIGSGKALPLKPVSVIGTLAAAPPAGRVGPEGAPIPEAKPLARSRAEP